MRHIRSSGFSLVELSIVLVILGLLVGGVLGGQALIKAAEMRAVAVETRSYRTAINAFLLKYNSLPGDTRMATRIWPQDADCANAASRMSASTYDGTCNGSGDGNVQDVAGFPEARLMWQHLSLAELIPERIDARGNATTGLGTVFPRSRYKNKLWGAGTLSVGGLGSTGILLFMDERGSSLPPVMSPAEAWSLDAKMDDGHPMMGEMWGIFGFGGDCYALTDSTPPATLDKIAYNLALEAEVCAPVFIFPKDSLRLPL